MRSLFAAAVKIDATASEPLRDESAFDRPADSMAFAVRLDEAALVRLRELDPTGRSRLVERVFDAFEASMQRMLPQLAAGLPVSPAEAQIHGLRLIVHTFKSSAATVGALAMARQCGELEGLLRDGQIAGVNSRIAALLTETVRVRVAMRALTGRSA